MSTKGIASLVIVFLVAATAYAAQISRVKTWSDNEVLTASDLNTEFNNVVNGVNSINNDNIISGAAISPLKIATSIDGDGITRNGTTGALSVSYDNSTIGVSGDQIYVKNAGITGTQIATSVAGNGLAGGGGSALSVGVDNSTVELSGDALRVKASGITGTQIAASVAGDGLSGGGGADFSVNVDNSTIELSGDTARVKDSGITSSKIAAENVTQDKIYKRAVATGAGAGHVARASDSGVFTTTSASLVTVTNQTVTLNTTGRPVIITVMCNDDCLFSTGNDATVGRFVIQQDGVTKCWQDLSGPAEGALAPCIEVPAAGTYDFRLQAQRISGTGTLSLRNVQLVVYEL